MDNGYARKNHLYKNSNRCMKKKSWIKQSQNINSIKSKEKVHNLI